MKIAQYITSQDEGGAESLTVAIAEELHNRGIPNIIFHHENNWIKRHAPEHHDLGRRWSSKTLPYFVLSFKKMLNHLGINFLHSHLYAGTLAGSLAAKAARIPSVATQHDIYTIEDNPHLIKYLKMSQTLGTKLITVSDQMRKVYYQHEFKNIFIIHNGVDTKKFYPRARHELDDEVLNIIYTGRLIELKNLSCLLTALSQLKWVGKSKFKLRIVGDGDQRQRLENQVTELCLNKHVEFLGLRSDISELLGASNLFILPSHTEGLSCSILEAMATGLPIIASHVGGNPELVRPGINGNLFPSTDWTALFELLNHYHDRIYLLRQMGMESRILTENKFSTSAMVDKYLDFY